MNQAIEIKNYESFLQAKKNLYLKAKLEEMKMKEGVKNGIANFTVVKVGSLLVNKISDSDVFKKVSNIVSTASLFKNLYQSFKANMQ